MPRSVDPVIHVSTTPLPPPLHCIHTTAIVKDVQVYTGRIIPNRNPVTSFGNAYNPYQNDPIMWGTVRAPSCSLVHHSIVYPPI